MKKTALLLILLLVHPAWLASQVTARQGTPSESPLKEFQSPMILDLPLQSLRDLPWQALKDFKEVRTYYCDDLVLSQLVVVKKEDKHRGQPSGVRLEIRGSVSVRPSYDRRAILRFDAVKGEERVAMVQLSQISAEEGKTRPFAAVLRLPPGAFERLFAEGPEPLLRVTVTVHDNS